MKMNKLFLLSLVSLVTIKVTSLDYSNTQKLAVKRNPANHSFNLNDQTFKIEKEEEKESEMVCNLKLSNEGLQTYIQSLVEDRKELLAKLDKMAEAGSKEKEEKPSKKEEKKSESTESFYLTSQITNLFALQMQSQMEMQRQMMNMFSSIQNNQQPQNRFQDYFMDYSPYFSHHQRYPSYSNFNDQLGYYGSRIGISNYHNNQSPYFSYPHASPYSEPYNQIPEIKNFERTQIPSPSLTPELRGFDFRNGHNPDPQFHQNLNRTNIQTT